MNTNSRQSSTRTNIPRPLIIAYDLLGAIARRFILFFYAFLLNRLLKSRLRNSIFTRASVFVIGGNIVANTNPPSTTDQAQARTDITKHLEESRITNRINTHLKMSFFDIVNTSDEFIALTEDFLNDYQHHARIWTEATASRKALEDTNESVDANLTQPLAYLIDDEDLTGIDTSKMTPIEVFNFAKRTSEQKLDAIFKKYITDYDQYVQDKINDCDVLVVVQYSNWAQVYKNNMTYWNDRITLLLDKHINEIKTRLPSYDNMLVNGIDLTRRSRARIVKINILGENEPQFESDGLKSLNTHFRLFHDTDINLKLQTVRETRTQRQRTKREKAINQALRKLERSVRNTLALRHRRRVLGLTTATILGAILTFFIAPATPELLEFFFFRDEPTLPDPTPFVIVVPAEEAAADIKFGSEEYVRINNPSPLGTWMRILPDSDVLTMTTLFRGQEAVITIADDATNEWTSEDDANLWYYIRVLYNPEDEWCQSFVIEKDNEDWCAGWIESFHLERVDTVIIQTETPMPTMTMMPGGD